jgi:hypothetical protein
MFFHESAMKPSGRGYTYYGQCAEIAKAEDHGKLYQVGPEFFIGEYGI